MQHRPQGKRASFDVSIEPPGTRFSAPAGQPLLLSALQAGVDLPSSCRNGTCRTCMQRLRKGRVSYRIEWPGLLAEEKAEGWILPCVAYPEDDLEIVRG
jgi:ferredoxin